MTTERTTRRCCLPRDRLAARAAVAGLVRPEARREGRTEKGDQRVLTEGAESGRVDPGLRVDPGSNKPRIVTGLITPKEMVSSPITGPISILTQTAT